MVVGLAIAAASGAYWLGIFIGSVLMGFLCSWLFRRSGHSSVLGFVIGFFLGLIGLIIALIVSFAAPRNRTNVGSGGPAALQPSGQARFCPNCGQAVAPGTRFCGSCGAQIA